MYVRMYINKQSNSSNVKSEKSWCVRIGGRDPVTPCQLPITRIYKHVLTRTH